MKIEVIVVLLFIATVLGDEKNVEGKKGDGKNDEGKKGDGKKDENKKGDGKKGDGKKDDNKHGHHNHTGHRDQTPGCENSTVVRNIYAHVCCPALPQIFESEVWRGCSSKQGFNSCAASDCLFKAYNTLTADGKFDAAKAKERLTIATNKNSAWPIKKIVDDCVSQAPADVKKWQEKMAKMNRSTPNCTNPENFAISQCIRRNLILSCPVWDKADANCTILMNFANSCPLYPFHDRGERHGRYGEPGGNKFDDHDKRGKEGGGDGKKNDKKQGEGKKDNKKDDGKKADNKSEDSKKNDDKTTKKGDSKTTKKDHGKTTKKDDGKNTKKDGGKTTKKQ